MVLTDEGREARNIHTQWEGFAHSGKLGRPIFSRGSNSPSQAERSDSRRGWKPFAPWQLSLVSASKQ